VPTNDNAPQENVVFNTKWFHIVSRLPPAYSEPHFSLRTKDYVTIIAVTAESSLLLVRQFRPALWTTTLELPSGHVEPNQTPEQAARAELIEETGHEAERFELLGNFSPDTGRLGNRLWCFFAERALPLPKAAYQPEPGVDPVLYRGNLQELLREREFCSAQNCAALFAALLAGKLKL
jgi:ADP-ribose pyrophosphatase